MLKTIKRHLKKLLLSKTYNVDSDNNRMAGYANNHFYIQKDLLNVSGVSEPIIFDVGANIGQSTRSYLKLFPNANIYCFEPFPECIDILKNKFSSKQKVTVIPKAVAEKPGQSKFYVNNFNPTNSLLPRPDKGRRYYPKYASPKTTINVDITTLDDFVEQFAIFHIDILKLDIQGGEMKALQGSKNILKSQAVSLICAETLFVPHYQKCPLFHHISFFLEYYGYSLYDIFTMKKAANGQLRFGNAIFVSPSIRAEVIDSYPEED